MSVCNVGVDFASISLERYHRDCMSLKYKKVFCSSHLYMILDQNSSTQLRVINPVELHLDLHMTLELRQENYSPGVQHAFRADNRGQQTFIPGAQVQLGLLFLLVLSRSKVPSCFPVCMVVVLHSSQYYCCHTRCWLYLGLYLEHSCNVFGWKYFGCEKGA